jgi:hypothetical protein
MTSTALWKFINRFSVHVLSSIYAVSYTVGYFFRAIISVLYLRKRKHKDVKTQSHLKIVSSSNNITLTSPRSISCSSQSLTGFPT